MLTAYKVFYDDKTSQEVNMAAGVTLEDAKQHYIGVQFEITEHTFRKAIDVIALPSEQN